MTVDKETLIKHRFWIALGVFGLLWLVGLILIPTVQGSNNAEVEKKFEDAKIAIKGVNDPKTTETFVKPLEGKENVLKDKKGDVWGIASQAQDGMWTWPEGGSSQLERYNNAPFGAYIGDKGCSEYGNKLYKQYLDGLNFADMIKPVEYHGGWESIVRPVSHWPVDPIPTVEECWLAQEDLWVKRELLGIISKTLDEVRTFKPYQPDKDAKPEAGRQLMRNANWELDLVTEPKDEKSKEIVISAKTKIKNINAWKRNLSLADVKFRVKQGTGNNFMEFAIPVDSLNWGETTDIKKAFAFGKLVIDPSKPLEVEQVLTWSTSPIKRIDALALGYNSHRTANRPCKAKQIGNQKPPADDPNNSAADSMSPAGMPPGGSYGVTSAPPGLGGNAPDTADMMRPGGFGKGDGKGLNKDLKRERYLDFTEQVRWMPIGMVLIVDQAYMQDLQTQVVNSRLRIQPTQISFHRAYDIRPSADNDKKDKGDKPSTGDTEGRPNNPANYGVGSMMMRGKPMFSGTGAYGPPSGPPGGGFPSIPGGGSWPGVGAGSTASVEEDPNLVELSVYGIASLYERPPKPARPAEKKP